MEGTEVAMAPEDLLAAAKAAATPVYKLSDYVDTVRFLKREQQWSYAQICSWLADKGVNTNEKALGNLVYVASLKRNKERKQNGSICI